MALLFFGAGLLEQAQDDCTHDAADRQSHTVHHGMVNDREDEDAAVRGAEGAAEGHGQRTGEGCADDTAGQDAQRVSRCVRDRALGDEAEAHDVVDDAVAALVGSPLPGAEGGGEGDGDGRHHAAHHDGSHDLIVAGGEGCGAEDVSRLVEGAAHVDAHHTGHDRAQQDLGGAAHGVQPVGHGGVDHAHDGVDAAHDRAHDEDAAQRVDEHGTDAVQAGGELFGDLLEELHHITGHETGQQSGQEAAGDAGGLTSGDTGEVGAVHGQHAACEADGQTRTVRNGHGDEARQDGEHIAEGRRTHRLEEGGQRGIHAEVGGIDAVIVQQEGQRYHDAAAHHEGQHMGDAVHQVLVEAAAKAVGIQRTTCDVTSAIVCSKSLVCWLALRIASPKTTAQASTPI